MKKCLLLIATIGYLTISCNQSNKSPKVNSTESNAIKQAIVSNNPKDTLPVLYINPDSLAHIDFNQDLNKKTLPELRYLRSLVFARNGQLFKEYDLRGYFAANYKWYDTLTTMVWMRIGNKIVDLTDITEDEKNFVDKIDNLIEEKQKQNYIGDDPASIQVAAENIVNIANFKNVKPEFLEKLNKNHFVIIPERVPQLFNIYEQNNYMNIPSFVTSDLYLQLFHMYFSYVLRTIEKQKFIPALEQITLTMYNNSKQIAITNSNPQIKQIAEFNQVFYAIPYELLTKKKLPIPQKYVQQYNQEIDNITNASGDYEGSKFLDITYFPYSLFKPRGYYTREDTLKQYFKAMMWIQSACFCRETNSQLKKATFAAYILSTASEANGKSLYDEYNAFYKTISFFIGEPDNLSILDITEFLKKKGINDVNKVADDKFISKVSEKLSEIVKAKNRIVPKIKFTCNEKINFMPQRYLFDNEILLDMADTTINPERAYPKGLDIFASLGNKTANDILFNQYKDDKKWDKFVPNLNKMKKMMDKFDNWDVSIYNKWFDCLKSLTEQGKNNIQLINTDAWNKKSLNTALASWSELKHDAILYSKQPSMAESGGGGMPTPPPPIIKGYIEPNIVFWKKLIETLDLTDNILDKFYINSEKISGYTKDLKKQVNFMLSASKKEVNKEELTEEEYNYIEFIGGQIDNLTLQIVLEHADGWMEVNSPDTCVSVIADVFLRNVPDCPKNGVLYEAVGQVNNIYPVVEIGGYLYLTRGAVLSHYEFSKPSEDRLTDEDWQKDVSSNKLPSTAVWFKDFILPSKYKPQSNEKMRYGFVYGIMGNMGIP
jgi:hypothetical protein